MLETTPLVVAIAVVSAFFVGLSKGGLPSIGTLAVPLLALVISPVAAAALLLPIYVASDMVGLYLYRRSYSGRNLAILLVGVSIGWAFSAHLSSVFIGMLVGVVGVLFCLNMWMGARYRRSPRQGHVPGGLFWGVLTGLTSFVSHSGGPPYQMYVLPQHLEKMKFAGTSTILFAIINAAKIVPYWELQQFGNLDVRLMTEILPDGLFFRVVQVSLLLLALKLIADYGMTLVA